MGSTYCGNLKISIFGQSHSGGIGVVIDGLPAGERIDMDALQASLSRRAPGGKAWSTPRKEADLPQFLSGLVDDVTCGAPLAALIENTNTRSQDYAQLRDKPRPGHADFTAQVKYGGFQDVAGGGHFSGRLTAPLCIAGGICLQILKRRGIEVAAHIASIAGEADRPFDPMGESVETLDALKRAPFPVMDEKAGERMRKVILQAKEEGDSVGGIVECLVTGAPAGLGEPMFGGMENRLAAALFGIPAVKGVEFGAGFGVATMRGSENNDPFTVKDGKVVTETNHAGGILGGITNGMPLVFRLAVKPTPSIAKQQQTVSLSKKQVEELVVTGRHDPCIVPRAVPVVEAVTALVLTDLLFS